MADPAQYQGYSFRPRSASLDGTGTLLTVTGTVRWRLAPDLDVDQHLTVWEQRSYKSGLTIGVDQNIVALSYLGQSGNPIPMQPAPAADVLDLETSRGVQDGYKWVAFRRPANAEPRACTVIDGTVEFTVSLTITPPRPDRQLIGVASRHATGSFVDGSTTSLWVLPRAPFP
jgi:hypothetical protein